MKKSLSDLVEMFNVGASEKGLKVNLKISHDFPKEILIDEQRIKQVILNIL